MLFICLAILFECGCGIYGMASQQGRSVPSNSTGLNTTISSLLANALPVYCLTGDVLPAMVVQQTPTALPGLIPTTPPRPYVPGGGGAAGTSNASYNMGGVYTTLAGIQQVSARMITLNDTEMHDMFQHKGGNYLQDYMATTQQEAERNFPNLLLMTTPIKIAGPNVILTVNDNVLAQQTIIDDLRKLNSYLSSTLKPVSTGRVSDSKGSHGLSQHKSTSPVTPSMKSVSKLTSSSSYTTTTPMSRPAKEQKSTQNIKNGPNSLWTSPKNGDQTQTSTSKPSNLTMSDKYVLVSTQTSSINMENTKKPKQQTATVDISSDKPLATKYASSSVRPTHKPATIQSVVSESLSALDNYLHGNLGFGKDSDLNSLWKEANTTIHPEVLFELELRSKRKRRQADGTVSMEQYCQLKGSKTQDGYLHMCSTCAVITKLPEHYFPRFVNEAVCKIGDSNCFVINGIPHGECRQRTITLNMRKKPNKCLLMVHNGENIMIDDWELYPKTIRVSCECLIKKNSFLAPYVKGSIPHH